MVHKNIKFLVFLFALFVLQQLGAEEYLSSNSRPSGLKASYVQQKTSTSPKKKTSSSSSYTYHTVKKGENLATIAKKYGTTVSAIKACNTLKNPNTLYVGSRIKVPKKGSRTSSSSSSKRTTSYKYHKVKKGENLATIAKKYGTTVSAIKACNSLKNPNTLYVGTRLKIPIKGGRASTSSSKRTTSYKYHKVKKGENLATIAKKYGTTVSAIKACNTLKNPNKLYVGTRLKIPQRGSTASKSKAPSTSVSSSDKKVLSRSGLKFSWPVNTISKVLEDGEDGVKAIGVIIYSSRGSAITSAENGTVKKVGYMRGYGNYVVIEHKSRFLTVYSQLGKVAVSEGKSVKKGSLIAYVDESSPSLHFQINHAGKPLNALGVLPKR